MKRTWKKHKAVIKAKGWWWRRSRGPDGAASVFEGGGGARACWERGVSKSVVLLTGDRGFESISLQRGVMRTLSPSEYSGVGGRVHKGLSIESNRLPPRQPTRFGTQRCGRPAGQCCRMVCRAGIAMLSE
jgi:hypothetical protein